MTTLMTYAGGSAREEWGSRSGTICRCTGTPPPANGSQHTNRRCPQQGPSLGTAARADAALKHASEGHLAYLGDNLALSFAHFYWVDGEDWGEDFWGTLPGWSSHANAGREVFDAYIDAAVAAFAQRLGPPEHDITAEGGTLAMRDGNWRHAAWRCGDNLLVIGPRHEGLSSFQFEEAVIYIGQIEATAPLPALRDFVS